MALQFACSCGHLLQVGEDLAGKRVRCPACRSILTAPNGEAIPEARLVDAAARPEPAAAKPAEAAAAPAPGARGETKCCGGAAVGGFMISMGSLVFGLVSLTAPVTWPVLGLLGTAVSSRGLRRIREGRAPAHNAGLARAGMAIGIGQVVVAALFWAGVFVVCAGGSCGGPRLRCRTTPPAIREVRCYDKDVKKIEECKLGDVTAPQAAEAKAGEDLEWCPPCPECPDGEFREKSASENK